MPWREEDSDKKDKARGRKSNKRGRGQRSSTHLFVSFLYEVSEQLEWTLVDVPNVDKTAILF